jgi:hypothetical protein
VARRTAFFEGIRETASAAFSMRRLLLGKGVGSLVRRYTSAPATRVGFNLWHTRAVLLYTADCNDYSPEFPTMCVEYGEAYLQKENGMWKVDHYDGTTF